MLRSSEGFALRPQDIGFQAPNLTRRSRRNGRRSGQGHEDPRNSDCLSISPWTWPPRSSGTLRGSGRRRSARALESPSGCSQRADGSLMNKDYAAGVFRRILKAASRTTASTTSATRSPVCCSPRARGSRASRRNWGTRARPRPCGYARRIPSQGKRCANALDRKTRPSVSAEAKVEPGPAASDGARESARRNWLPGLGSNQRFPD
jgi:hypothetical protein